MPGLAGMPPLLSHIDARMSACPSEACWAYECNTVGGKWPARERFCGAGQSLSPCSGVEQGSRV
eukprot:1158570-Pelagomonas_calceolata.AAC.7